MQKIVDFVLELDKLKGVTRATRPIGLARYENSAEHSWQIAMLAASLAPYAEAHLRPVARCAGRQVHGAVAGVRRRRAARSPLRPRR